MLYFELLENRKFLYHFRYVRNDRQQTIDCKMGNASEHKFYPNRLEKYQKKCYHRALLLHLKFFSNLYNAVDVRYIFIAMWAEKKNRTQQKTGDPQKSHCDQWGTS